MLVRRSWKAILGLQLVIYNNFSLKFQSFFELKTANSWNYFKMGCNYLIVLHSFWGFLKEQVKLQTIKNMCFMSKHDVVQPKSALYTNILLLTAKIHVFCGLYSFPTNELSPSKSVHCI